MYIIAIAKLIDSNELNDLHWFALFYYSGILFQIISLLFSMSNVNEIINTESHAINYLRVSINGEQ